MRALAVALAALAFLVPTAGARTATRGRVALLHPGKLIVLDLATKAQTVVLARAPAGPVHWSGDGKLVSDAGRIAGGPALPTSEVLWAARGETAAYQTKAGAVVLWTPRGGSRAILPASWGATSLAWGTNGRLVVGRSACHVPCGVPLHQEVWVWQHGVLSRVAGALHGVDRPLAAGVTPDGRALWWADPQGSGSIAADGLFLFANRTHIARTLVFPDYVVRCGAHLALAAGGDRFTVHGKWISFDGRNVSHDASRSWVSPSCSAGGTLVAAASRNRSGELMGDEHRAIWQLLPTRRQLTRPPTGWTDENPHVLSNGSILFVRTHQTSRRANSTWYATEHGELELFANDALTPVANVTFTANVLTPLGYDLDYYGHYGWPWRIAVAP